MPGSIEMDGNQQFEQLVATLTAEVGKPTPTQKLCDCLGEIMDLSRTAETEALRRRYASVVDALGSEAELILRNNGVSFVN